MNSIDDIWFAAKSTRIIYMPPKLLETFGESTVSYFLVSDAPGMPGKVVIRIGQVIAARPRIMTPQNFFQENIENFNEDAKRYFKEVLDHEESARIVQYGLHFSKHEYKCYTVSGECQEEAERAAAMAQDDLTGVHGVMITPDATWEVSLMYFIVLLVRRSFPAHARDFLRHGLIGGGVTPALRQHVAAELDSCHTKEEAGAVAARLREMGLFDQFEDEFYECYRRVSK